VLPVKRPFWIERGKLAWLREARLKTAFSTEPENGFGQAFAGFALMWCGSKGRRVRITA
jgi:hypothetical protein